MLGNTLLLKIFYHATTKITHKTNGSFFSCIGIIALVSICVLGSSTSVADQTSFDKAVSIFSKGLKECVEANSVRGKNLNKAKRHHSNYLRFKAEAISIDESILSSTKRSMQKNLNYCDKVSVNLLRSEAVPILEEALKHCDKAKEAIEANDPVKSRTHITRYKKAKEEALSVTELILKNFALASRVRQCTRIESKITKAEDEIQQQEGAARALITLLTKSTTACASANSLTVNNKIPMAKLNSVKKHLKTARSIRYSQNKYITVRKQAKETPERDSSKKILRLQTDSLICIEKLKVSVKKVENQRQNIITSIDSKANTVQEALTKCKAIKLIVMKPELKMTELVSAILPWNEAKQLQATVIKSTSYKNAKKYPTWTASKKLLKLVSRTRECEKSVSIKYKKAVDKLLSEEKAETKAKVAKEARIATERAAAQKLVEEEAVRQEAEERRKVEENIRKEAERQAAKEKTARDRNSLGIYRKTRVEQLNERRRQTEEEAADKTADKKEAKRRKAEKKARKEEAKKRKAEEKALKKAERKAAKEKAAKERAEKGERDRSSLGGYRKSRVEQLEERRRQAEENE